MGGVNRLIEECKADKAMNEWIRKRVDHGVEPGTLEWEDAKHLYLLHIAYDPDELNESFEDELVRLSREDLAYELFRNQMSDLEDELPSTPSESLLKMAYSYSVTLMETCLGDMIKCVVLSDDYYMKNAINSVSELKSIKLSLMDVYSDGDIVRKKVLKTLTNYLYHNIEKIVPVYSAVLGEASPKNVLSNMRSVILITRIRHDIVHRNGTDKYGNPVELSKSVVLRAMKDINDFVEYMKMSIDAASYNRQPNHPLNDNFY